MEFPGARQMGIMRRLFESRAWHTLEPDQSIIVAGQGNGENYLQAARSSDGKFLFVYLPRGSATAVDMTKINGKEALAHWFNLRDYHDGRRLFDENLYVDCDSGVVGCHRQG